MTSYRLATIKYCDPLITPVSDIFNKNLFPMNVGVANIAKYLDRLEHKPGYITNLSESDGFCELVKLLV